MKVKKFLVYLLIASIFYFSLLTWAGVGLYNDSEQYLAMHIHREPAYPIFLWVCQLISPVYQLWIAVIVQSVVSAVATAYFVFYLSDVFSFSRISDGIVFGITVASHIVTPMVAQSGLVLSAAILTESICIPLYLLFAVSCHKMLLGNTRSILTSALWALFLVITRTQFLVAIILWLLCMIAIVIHKKQWKYGVFAIIGVCVLLTMRTTITKSYNYLVHGRYITNTYGDVSLLTHVLYQSNSNMITSIEDDILREACERIDEVMVEEQLYSFYFDGNLLECAGNLENLHDTIKFDAIEGALRTYGREQGLEDYIEQDLYADEIAGELRNQLFPQVWKQWALYYGMLTWNGIVRSIAVVHPIFYGYTAILMIASVYYSVMGIRKKETSKSAWFLLFGWFSVMGISSATAITIMCLSRYMIYSLPIFYVGCYVTMIEKYQGKGVVKWLIKS